MDTRAVDLDKTVLKWEPIPPWQTSGRVRPVGLGCLGPVCCGSRPDLENPFK
ncbi:MAG: hypothetical protein R2861_14925 [Desulfobacterales bacterium]